MEFMDKNSEITPNTSYKLDYRELPLHAMTLIRLIGIQGHVSNAPSVAVRFKDYL
jgi:hypothetical protein